jgi:hypothetical protein
MRNALVLLLGLIASSVYSQINIIDFHYKVSECGVIDSAEYYKVSSMTYPSYKGGDDALVNELKALLESKKIKSKDQGKYTAVINGDWTEITVTSTSEKVKDIKLFHIANFLRESKSNWNPLIANEKEVNDYVLTISFEVWVE